MNIQEWAERLNGREYTNEITREEEIQAREDGVVIIFGASDDLMEIRGAVDGEIGCFEGGYAPFNSKGLLSNECSDPECPYWEKIRDSATMVEGIWVKDGYSWVYETKIPHATFDIMEYGEKYCRGVVFALKDIA